MKFSNAGSALVRRSASLLGVLVATAGLTVLAGAQPAAASGCTVPPCGAVKNNSIYSVTLRYNDDNTTWKYTTARPGQTVGGFLNDRLDIDGFYAPDECRTEYSVRAGSVYFAYGEWVKVASNETATIRLIACPG